ncbi:hypothetical protein DPMN_114736 [Dreissena polymorpha]|uniref:Uncharacterized protein n=1 Tax=Dreissena polymorpha TaxID=45954 RepID=A0A9D4QSS5_DREPO|nr:hypothetical protein DPMN_114736 [Dreissena polymorpha]
MFHRISTRIPINTASETQLRSLPGIGVRTAQAIIDYRERVGPIDEEKLAMTPYIRMSKDLLDLIDFIPYGRQFPTSQYDEMDKLSDDLHQSSLQDPYYRAASRPHMAYADSDNANLNNRFPGRDKSFFRQDYTSAGTGVDYPATDMRLAYSPVRKHPFAGYSPKFSNQRLARTFGYADRTPANHPTYSDQGQGHRDLQMKRIGNLPKTLTYDGKSNWRAFYVKFSKYAEAQRWAAQDCKDNLCWCLTGKAGDFFANLVEKYDNMEYFDILKRFEKQLGIKIYLKRLQLPSTLLDRRGRRTLMIGQIES